MKSKLFISKRALTQRINRKLAQENPPEQLKASRGERQKEKHGDYYVVERGHGGGLVREYVVLEKLGKQLGVLAHYERVEAA